MSSALKVRVGSGSRMVPGVGHTLHLLLKKMSNFVQNFGRTGQIIAWNFLFPKPRYPEYWYKVFLRYTYCPVLSWTLLSYIVGVSDYYLWYSLNCENTIRKMESKVWLSCFYMHDCSLSSNHFIQCNDCTL